MRVLMISGDQNLTREGTTAHERFLLQKNAVEALELIVWPKQSLKPFFISGTFDVITSQDPFWRGLISFFAARRLRAKLNVQVHAQLSAQSPLKRAVARFVLARADSVRVVSPRVEKEVRLLTDATVSILPVFIDVARFENLEHATHPRFAKTILWIGRFEQEKDPLYAIEVLKRVRAAGLDAGLIMLGAGSLLEKLKEKTKKEGLESHIEFLGWQDPKAFLSQADVVLCTSQAESFGASMIEALASGVPVISPDVGVAREAGAIVRPKAELSGAIIETLSNGARGKLLLQLLSKEEWVNEWKKSLQ